MAVPLPGYKTLRSLRSSARARVYEAECTADGRRVVAKVFDVADPDIEVRAEHEFSLVHQLDVEGVVRALGLERVGDQLVLLFEQVPGVDLAQHAGGRALELDEFLAIARALARTLAQVHERGVLHGDIKPSNILIDSTALGGPHARRVFLADFGLSRVLEEGRAFADPELVEGTLPYISPERTGRIKRAVDFRSDLYSLGATFYELLAGRRPFAATTALELIHAHIARRPRALHELRGDLPVPLAAMIMRLLEKLPERRYQSAAGLLADLDRLVAMLESGTPPTSFVLGEHDHPAQLQLPHRLYGRSAELGELETALASVITQRQARVVLIVGEAGAGKTALLDVFEELLARRGGQLARGSFAGTQPDQPYRGIVEAITGVCDRLLIESDERLADWREHLHGELGPLAREIVELTPRGESLFGELPELPPLEPLQAMHRVELALARFLTEIARRVPLVLALDDIHEADARSLELVGKLLCGGIEGSVLIAITLRRDALADAGVARLLDALGERVTRLEPGPLAREDLRAWLSDMLGRPPEQLDELVELVARRTDSNPLFIQQFVQHLADTKLLRAEASGWRWDSDAIAHASIPADLFALLDSKLARLPEDQRRVLAIAACIGDEFQLRTLEAVAGVPLPELSALLRQLELAGLLVASGARTHFAHERLVAAAAAFFDAEQRAKLHWKIGCHLLEASGAGDSMRGFRVVGDSLLLEARSTQGSLPGSLHGGSARVPDELLFPLVEHLASGFAHAGPLLETTRLHIARQAYTAGRRALRSAAWPVALRLLAFGVTLIEPWTAAARKGRGEHELAFAIHFAHAQAQALAGTRADAEASFDALLGWEISVAQRGQVVARLVRILALQDRVHEALRVGLDELARLGYPLRTPSSIFALLRWSRAAWAAYRRSDPAKLPVLLDEDIMAVLEVTDAVKTLAFVVDTKLFVALTGLAATLTLRHGRHVTTPVALAQFGIAVQVGFDKPDVAAKLCDQALALCEPSHPNHPRAESAALLVWPLSRPLRSLLPRMVAVQRRAAEVGDVEVAGFQTAISIGFHLDAGVHLRELVRVGERWEAESLRIGNEGMLMMLRSTLDLVRMATAPEDHKPAPLPTFEQVRSNTKLSGIMINVVVTNAVFARVLRGDWAGALREADALVESSRKFGRGTTQPARLAIYQALALGQRWPRADKRERRAVRKRMLAALAQVRYAARWNPHDYAAPLALVEAEHAALRGEEGLAHARFEQARALAEERGQLSLIGIICEAFARFAQRRGRIATAQEALRAAIEGHRQWGATALVRELEKRHALWLSDARALGDRNTLTLTRRFVAPPPSSESSIFALDIASVLSTLQAISEELRLDEVIMRVLEGALENAGAERGTLLLEREGVVGLVAASDGNHLEFFAEAIALRDAGERVPLTVLNFVMRTGKSIVLDDAQQDSRFAGDPYVAVSEVRSLLCMPIVKQSRRVGALVLENRLSTHGFDAQRLEILRILIGQAASALDNARLYDALQRSEAQWRSLVEGVPDIIALLDERGRIEFINHTAPYRLGAESAIGQPADRFLDPPDVAPWQQAFAEVLATGELRELEVRWTAGEGVEPSVYVIRLAPITFGGRVGKILSISTDVSERRRSEAQRARLESQLRQQQRLESIGTLASGVAHEINNPVQGIMNYAELIAERSGDPALVSEFAAEIGDESQRVATIVRNLLAFSRQERESPYETADLAALVEDTLSLIRTVIRRDQIQLDVKIAAGLPPLRCRTQQIQQVIMNLVTNARDALNERWKEDFGEHKRIELRADAFEREGRAWVRLSVEDRGGGIPAANLARIFDPFFTTKRNEQGTGLGLAVSQGIAHEHGGELRVESEEGVGSCFHLELPVVGRGT